jgi:hypothetical protein
MNDNNKEITEEALDILYSFEEPLEQHIRSKYSELNFDCILLGAIHSKTKETSEAVILVDIRFEMEEDSIKLAPLDDLKSHCKVYLENEIINERLFKDDKNANFEWSIGIEVIED